MLTKITDTLQEICNKIYKFIPQSPPSPEELKKVKIVAHRGAWNLSDRLENTLPAFDYCLNKNIWAIEFDIRWTKDNVPVVHHDASTSRVFSKNCFIHETTFEQIKADFPQIPTLSEVVRRYGKKRHLMIELKTIQTEKQISILADILSPLTPIDDYHFMSLDLNRFKNISFVPSKTFVSIARTNIQNILQESLKAKLGAVTGQYLLLSNKIKAECHNKNIKAGTGFPDSRNLLFREARRGVDWIFTNKASELASYLDTELKH